MEDPEIFLFVVAAANLLNIVLFWLANPDIGILCGGSRTTLVSH